MTQSIVRQRGFTLLEIATAVTLLGILGFSLIGTFTPLLQAKTELATRERLNKIALALGAAYRVNARTVDAVATREFRLSPTLVIGNNTTAANATTQATLATIATFGQVSPSDLERDEYVGLHTYLISNPLSYAMPGGYNIVYRKIAIVSPGYNGTIDAGTTMDAATGNLTLAGDDLGVVVDGFQIQKDLTDRTVAAVNKMVNAYQNYFTNRYLANPTRDVSVDYFASAGTPLLRWDTAGVAGNSGAVFADVSTLNFGPALGLAASDMLDSYGTAIQVDNSSNIVRNPNNFAAAMQIPPYSALIRAQLMGGQFYQQSAIGAF